MRRVRSSWSLSNVNERLMAHVAGIRTADLAATQDVARDSPAGRTGADEIDAPMTIGEVAHAFGITVRALRFYESKRLIRPRRPYRPTYGAPSYLQDVEDLSAPIADLEPDGKGVPILIKQYLKAGGRVLGFNVDPRFSNVLDVLMMADLRRTPPRSCLLRVDSH